MIEWGGWTFDETARRMIVPFNMMFTKAEASFIATILSAEGALVPHARLVGNAGKMEADPLNIARVYASRLRFKLSSQGVALTETVFGHGYRAVRATKVELSAGEIARQKRVVDILIDQFEATGPHARSVASMIGEIYR